MDVSYAHNNSILLIYPSHALHMCGDGERDINTSIVVWRLFCGSDDL
jgi:hypothetical protein